MDSDKLSLWLEHGIDIDRHIVSVGTINSESVNRVIRACKACCWGADYLRNQPPSIVLNIYSDGGDIDALLALLDYMEVCPLPIHTVASGDCSSAALYVLMSGEPGYRSATPNTIFMYHDTQASMAEQGLTSLQSEIQYVQRVDGMVKKIIRKCNADVGWFEKLGNSGLNHYFSVDEAIEHGVIDKIVGS